MYVAMYIHTQLTHMYTHVHTYVHHHGFVWWEGMITMYVCMYVPTLGFCEGVSIRDRLMASVNLILCKMKNRHKQTK